MFRLKAKQVLVVTKRGNLPCFEVKNKEGQRKLENQLVPSELVMPDWGTNPVERLFFVRFEYIRDCPNPRQSGMTVEVSTRWMTHHLKSMCHTFSVCLSFTAGSASKAISLALHSYWECVTHHLKVIWNTMEFKREDQEFRVDSTLLTGHIIKFGKTEIK